MGRRYFLAPVMAIGVAVVACAPLLAPGGSQVQNSPAPGTAQAGAPIASLSVTLGSLTLGVGKQQSLGLLVRDQNGLIPTGGLTWQSSDATVVSVNPNTGLASGAGAGSAVVTVASSSNPSASAQIQITVVQAPAVSLIKITPAVFSLNLGNTQQLTAEVDLPDGEINSNVEWSSSDNTVATVNPTTGVVTAVKPGDVTLVAAYAPDPQYKGLADLTVLPAGATPAPSPSPTSVVFGPGATPIPTPTPTSASSGTTPASTPTPTPSPTATPPGAVLGSWSVGTSPVALAISPDGSVWTANGDNTVTRVSAGSRPESFSIGYSPAAITTDATGDAWATVVTGGSPFTGYSTGLMEVSPSGQTSGPFNIPGCDGEPYPLVYSGGAVWANCNGFDISDKSLLTEYSTTGSVIATTSVGGGAKLAAAYAAGGSIVFPENFAALASSFADGKLWEFDSTTFSSQPFNFDTNSSFAFDADASGNVWALEAGTGGLELQKLTGGNISTVFSGYPNPCGIATVAVSSNGDVWMGMTCNSAPLFLGDGKSIPKPVTLPEITEIDGMLPDSSGHIWILDTTTATLYEILG